MTIKGKYMLRQNSSKNNVLLFIPFVALFVIIFIMNNGWIYAIDDVFLEIKSLLMDWIKFLIFCSLGIWNGLPGL